MRAYYFGNMYISQIQHGIQAAHVTAELFVKYPLDHECEVYDVLRDWAANHKTMILLNGGYSENLHELYTFFDSEDNPYPFTKFHESQEALDGALTSVGIILPSKIYDGAREMQRVKRQRRDDDARMLWENYSILMFPDADGVLEEVPYDPFEVELMERLNTFRLA